MDDINDFFPHLRRKNQINYTKNVKKKGLSKKMSFSEFWTRLGAFVKDVDQQGIENELRDYFQPGELVGMDKKIKVAVNQLIDEITA